MPQPLGLRVRDEARLVGLRLTGDGLDLPSIARWLDERGFGFIRRDDRQPDLFVHVNALLDGGGSLVKGKRVSFEVAEDARSGKKQAINVRVLT